MKNKTIKKVSTWLLKVIAAGMAAMTVLSVVAYFYSYTGIHITNTSKSTDYTWLSFQRMNNMKEGFSFVKMDKNGFNNTESPGEKTVDILLMGSSHMEAYQVNQNQNCGFLLNELIPEYYTYNIGISGHTIYRIADNIPYALREYTPEKYVVIETNTVQLDIYAMNEVIEKKASAIKSHDSGLLFYLQKIPAFKPIYNQLDNWLKAKSENNNYETYETVITEEYSFALSEFLGLIKNEAEKNGVIPIIFYAPNEQLTKDGDLVFQTDKKYFEIYEKTCKELGIVFVDMSDSFAKLYTDEKTMAHGFPNTAVGTGHLNKYGHKTVAEKIAAEIHKMEEK